MMVVKPSTRPTFSSTLPGANANSGVRILDFSTSIEAPVPDQEFEFTLANTDLDGDAVTQDTEHHRKPGLHRLMASS